MLSHNITFVTVGNVRANDLRSASGNYRSEELTPDELEEFAATGYLRLGRVLDDATIAQLHAVIARHRSSAADLLDPDLWEEGEGGEPPEGGRDVSFLFNLWREEPDYRAVALDPRFGRWAAQALGATGVRLLEDNALIKDPGLGGTLRWHQDYSYWPLAQPNAVTIWIALDAVPVEAGAVSMVPGSHLLGERLPVVFGTGAAYHTDRRPSSVRPIDDPHQCGMPIDTMVLKPGEATLHHALTWHASGPNDALHQRRAGVFRYVADGTIWLGERRHEFNYTSEELGLGVGDPIGGDYFPLVPIGGPDAPGSSNAWPATEVQR
jgi:hypothetical protein